MDQKFNFNLSIIDKISNCNQSYPKLYLKFLNLMLSNTQNSTISKQNDPPLPSPEQSLKRLGSIVLNRFI